MSTQDSQKHQHWLESHLMNLFAVVPRIPLITRVILLNLLSVSESSKYLDVRSDVTVSFIRSLVGSKPGPIGKTQAMTTRDPGVKGRMWVCQVASQVPPENDIRDALLAVIEALRDNGADSPATSTSPRIPEIASVEAEWTGYRAKALRDAPLPAIPEAEKYAEMMRECRSSPTVLYFHGGAYYLCDPVTHRPTTKKLSKLTGGRVYSVRYRLAPQHPFPSALLDALVSYFTLLYPPPGSIHEAVPASDIVFGGDSAGGNLTLALLQTLLEIRRQGRTIRWFGVEREVTLPAAATCCSPWLDVVQSMPSWDGNARWDFLPSQGVLEEGRPQPPADSVWPTDPPRRHLYCDDADLLHPLVSLQLARSWAGAPPVYLCCGWECLADETRWFAARLAREDTPAVPVVFEEYEAMPHVSALVLPHLEASRRNLRSWAAFITRAVEDPAAITSSYTTVRARTLEEVPIDPRQLTSFSDDDVRRMARDKAGHESPAAESRLRL